MYIRYRLATVGLDIDMCVNIATTSINAIKTGVNEEMDVGIHLLVDIEKNKR